MTQCSWFFGQEYTVAVQRQLGFSASSHFDGGGTGQGVRNQSHRSLLRQLEAAPDGGRLAGLLLAEAAGSGWLRARGQTRAKRPICEKCLRCRGHDGTSRLRVVAVGSAEAARGTSITDCPTSFVLELRQSADLLRDFGRVASSQLRRSRSRRPSVHKRELASVRTNLLMAASAAANPPAPPSSSGMRAEARMAAIQS